MEDHLTPPIELGEEMAPMFQRSMAKSYDIKLNFSKRNQMRRIRLKECCFNELKQTVQKMFPNGNFVEFFYYDDEDNKITFSTDAEMECMFSYIKQAFVTDTPKVFVKEEETQVNDSSESLASLMLPDETDFQRHAMQELQQSSSSVKQPKPIEGKQSEKNTIKVLHPNVYCDGCDTVVLGHRFKCLICEDFDLCESCERTGAHAEHAMMRLVNPGTLKPTHSSHNQQHSIVRGFGMRGEQGFGGFARSSFGGFGGGCLRLSKGGFGSGFGCPSKLFDESKFTKERAGLKYQFNSDSENAKKAMSHEEKRKLSKDVKALPVEQLTGVVDILEEHENGNSNKNPEEIEIDYETMKTITLRELEAYIYACNKKDEKSSLGPHHHKHHHHHHHHHKSVRGEHGYLDRHMKWMDKMADREQKFVDKVAKKCVKKEKLVIDRAFRALNRSEVHPRTDEELHFTCPPPVNRQSSGVDYLKDIAKNVQKVLVPFGIECEGFVKDNQGNVQAHVPPVAPNGQHNKSKENKLNPSEKHTPAGVLERPSIVEYPGKSRRTIGCNLSKKPTKKTPTKDAKLGELREYIKIADERATEKKQTSAAETDKAKKTQPTAPPMEQQQKCHEPKEDPIMHAAKEAIQQASKAAFDGLQVASKIAAEIISGFDPAAGESTNRAGQNLAEGAKERIENLLPHVMQNATAFQAYLEQLNFSHATNQEQRNPNQNAQPPQSQTKTDRNGIELKKKMDDFMRSSEMPHTPLYGEFPLSPQMPHAPLPSYIQQSTEQQLYPSLAQQNDVSVQTTEQSAQNNVETNVTLQAVEQRALEHSFSQLSVVEQSQQQVEVVRETIESDKKAKEKQAEEFTEKEELKAQKKGGSDRKNCDSFSSSDSDVEILDGEEAELEDNQEGKENEIEPSLPPSNGSSGGSLKRKAADSMDLSVHTAIGIDEESNVMANAKSMASSRSSSLSSLHSYSSSNSSSDSGWMVVKKESFKRLCDFYEKRRRLEATDGFTDSFIAGLEKERQEALGIQQPQESAGNEVDRVENVNVETTGSNEGVDMAKKMVKKMQEQATIHIGDEPDEQQSENSCVNGGMNNSNNSSSLMHEEVVVDVHLDKAQQPPILPHDNNEINSAAFYRFLTSFIGNVQPASQTQQPTAPDEQQPNNVI